MTQFEKEPSVVISLPSLILNIENAIIWLTLTSVTTSPCKQGGKTKQLPPSIKQKCANSQGGKKDRHCLHPAIKMVRTHSEQIVISALTKQHYRLSARDSRRRRYRWSASSQSLLSTSQRRLSKILWYDQFEYLTGRVSLNICNSVSAIRPTI